MEEDEYKKLPADQKVQHKLWKARVCGYEEITKQFQQIDDEKSPEFGKYLGLVKKFVSDSNALGQEKGLEATLAYVENYAHAGKTVSEVMSGIVTKCLAAPKTKTKELALQVILMYIEIEKQEAVIEELLKGTEQKNPKIVAASIQSLTTALREFGIKIINPKPMIKKIGVLFSDRDKNVRDEARSMVFELYRWMGPSLKSHLQCANLQAVQMTELETEFEKIEYQKATPTRYIRSQQKQSEIQATTETVDGTEPTEEEITDNIPDIDPYSLLDPVDILSKLPKDFFDKIEAKKWQERKEALEALETLAKNPKLENGEYGDVIRALKKVIQKDSNVICVSLAAKCIAGLATGLKKSFQTYSGALVTCLLEKFKEKKQNVVTAVKEAIDAVYLTTNLEAILEDVLESLNNKNPSVKSETSLFLARAFTKTQPSAVNKKLLKALVNALIKNINESDPAVRESSAEALGTLMKLVGEKTIGPFLIELEKDNHKMNKIKEFFEKAEITVKVVGVKKRRPQTAPTKTITSESTSPPQTSKPVKKASVVVAKSSSVKNIPVSNEAVVDEESTNGQDLVTRVDISDQITESLISELSDKNWKVRIETLNKISNIIQEAKFIKPNIADLPQSLAARLTEINGKIAQTALSICQLLVKAMGPSSKQYIRIWFPGILQTLGDNKAWLRASASETISVISEQCGYKEFFDGEMIGDALKTGSPDLRSELWKWLAEILPKIPTKTIPKEELVICVPMLYNNLEDRKVEVRKNAADAILGVMMHLGFEAMVKQSEKLKPGSKTVVMGALEKAKPNLPAKPLPKQAPVEQKTVKGGRPSTNKQNAVKTKASNIKTSTSTTRKKDEDVDFSPLLVKNGLKQQRNLDESKLKVIKWNFTQPREEFFDLLKDQMNTANVNKTLIANMFHLDFRYHIKAIESLMEDLPDNSDALVANLDLILKWLTLRFFDTNPSVLLKGLEYLRDVFSMLIEKKYNMSENEGSCFIPYLVLKVGDPKDSVRNGVRSLLKQITRVFPPSRLTVYVMEGVKSKNARQRAECLEVMASLIEDYSTAVCQPTPTICLKEIAKLISDRDNSVRNAALNCMVQAYAIVGEKLYKMVGSMSDKDRSLLEERIKWAGKKAILSRAINSEVPVAEVPPSSRNGTVGNVEIIQNEEDQDIDDDDALLVVPLPPAIVAEPPKRENDGPFKLDPEIIAELDKITSHFDEIPIAKIDLAFLDEEVKMPSYFHSKTKNMPMPLSPPKPVLPNRAISQHVVKKSDSDIARAIKSINTPNMMISSAGISQFQEILQNPIKLQYCELYEEDFISAVVNLLVYLNTLDPVTDTNVLKLYRAVLKCVDTFYSKPQLGKQVSSTILKQLIHILLVLIVEQKLENCENVFVKTLNCVCVKVIEQSDHTAVLCVLIKLITEYIGDQKCPFRQLDLVMKCIWKVIKLMPNWGDQVDYELVLVEAHAFFIKYPSKWWTDKQDTPLRTIKTTLHSIIKIKGANSMQLLSKISNPAESELESYMLRLLKTMKIAQAQDVPLQSQKKTISRANHNTLTEIFQKIGSKEDTKNGLNQLYDFMEQNPDADIEPFLSKSSKFFQDYIKNGLKGIEASRKVAKAEHPVLDTINRNEAKSGPYGTPEYYAERLNKFKSIFKQLKEGKFVDHSEWPEVHLE